VEEFWVEVQVVGSGSSLYPGGSLQAATAVHRLEF